MSFQVSKEAAEWYKDEMGLSEGDLVRFYVKLYGGIPTIHPNYFLGVSIGKEGSIAIQDEVEGITFYFSDEDVWFLEEYDLKVEFEKDEAQFHFEQK